MGCVELMNLEEEEEPYKGINNIEVCKNVEKYKERCPLFNWYSTRDNEMLSRNLLQQKISPRKT